ncbi:hypothetical protein PYW08_005349 [Mythimna loreyi]|uniref:Uncharacterized protein n=1 Tax=Mythimna loreyi TaxID=667449 RepID=A0ACC2QGX8_9NEOP|nr:hypothetical protein PYW08_005349 [Mythimna loreyi]
MFANFVNKFKTPKEEKVLITGFGPFGECKPNPSWEAVNAIDTGKNYGSNIEWVKEKVEVSYEYVNQTVQDLLDKEKPHLIIHVGVDPKVKCLQLEKQAYKHGYIKHKDIHDKLPPQGVNPSPGNKCYATIFNVEALADEYNKHHAEDNLRAETSTDAGRFLCEYIYYTSLSYRKPHEDKENQRKDRIPTLFVHVPFDNYYKPKQLARALERITQLCLKQLKQLQLAKTS